MENDNRCSMLADANNQPSVTGKWRLILKFAIIIVVTGINYFAMSMQSYTVNEWTQHRIKEIEFTNETMLTNFSACETVNHSAPNYIRYTHVQQEAARWQLYNTITSTVPGFITAFVYPAYSDAYGRRYLFILSLTGVFLLNAASAVTIYFKADLVYFILGYLAFGLSGTSYCLLAATFSYIADITTDGQQRTAGITIVQSCMLIHSTLGALATGFFIHISGYASPALTAAVLSLVALLLAIFLIPESLAPSARSKVLPIHKNVKRILNFYTSSDFKGKRSLYILLILCFIFYDVTSVHRPAIETLYQLGMPFCWDSKQIGYFATLTSLSQGIVNVGLVRFLQKCLSDEAINLLAGISNISSFILEALAYTDLMLYFVAVPAVLSYLITPTVRGIMSAMTPADRQGALFASLGVAQNFCWLVATFGDNMIYAATIGFFNGFVFIVLAASSTVGLALMWTFMLTKKRLSRQSTEECEPVNT